MPATPFRGLLLALLPLTAVAQQPAPRLYVGAGAQLLYLAPFEPYATTRFGPAATLGVELSRRWAVETGAQLARNQESNDYYLSSAPSYTPQLTTIAVRYATLVVPLVARYTFTPASARLRVEALGGLSWIHGATRVQYISQAGTDGFRYASNNLGVVLGPQLRYTFGPAFAAKLSVPLNLVALGDGEGSFRERLFLSPQLGVQYTFAY